MDVCSLIDTHTHTAADAAADSCYADAAPGKSFACSWHDCDRSFARKSDLVRHFRIHTGVKPFECPWAGCEKRFIQRSALKVHYRTHSGERPHTCEVCERSFSDSSSLARHRRTHTGVRPYGCEHPGCSKRFTRKTSLRKHMQTHDPAYTKPRRRSSVETAAAGSPMHSDMSSPQTAPVSRQTSPAFSAQFMTTPSPRPAHRELAQYHYEPQMYTFKQMNSVYAAAPRSPLDSGASSASTACNSPTMYGHPGTVLPPISSLLH